MPEHDKSQSLESLGEEIGRFIRSLKRPVLVEDDVELLDLVGAEWRVTPEFGKLILQVWNRNRSIALRVEGIAYRDRDRIGLFVRKAHARETSTIEIREFTDPSGRKNRTIDRTSFRRELLAMLEREHRGWKFELVSNRSDREHSFSAWYTRGLARRGRQGWAFLGLHENESPAAADSILAFALLWLDHLRKRGSGLVVPGLKLFLPDVSPTILSRIACLAPRSLQLEIFEWRPGNAAPRPIDLAVQQPVNTRLVTHAQGFDLLERHNPLLRELLGELYDRVVIAPDAAKKRLSIRVAGLELAIIEGDLAPRILFGLEGQVRQLGRASPAEFRDFIRSAVECRRADSSDTSHELYRVQAERWLESLVVRDLTKLDLRLDPRFAYSQVPAFSNVNRGVIDILGIRDDARLAVIELKLHEEINLPFQALDYWIAVKEIAARRQFQAFGYFQGIEPAASSPLLYLVAPAFRFHSSTDLLLRYLDPSIEVVKVGINQEWRNNLKVLFRRERKSKG